MSIRVACQSCSAAFAVRDETVGRSVKCPKCGERTPVSADNARRKPTATSVTRPTPKSEPADDTGDLSFDDLAQMERDAEHDEQAAVTRRKSRSPAKNSREISRKELDAAKSNRPDTTKGISFQRWAQFGAIAIGLVVISYITLSTYRWYSVRSTRAVAAEKHREALHIWAQLGGRQMPPNPERKGPILVYERTRSSGFMDVDNLEGLGPITLSRITFDLPAELQARGDEPAITVCFVTKAKELIQKKYRRVKAAAEQANDGGEWATHGNEGTETLTGGVAHHATLMLGYWRNDKFELVGLKSFRTETPDVLVSKMQLSMAAPVGPLIRDWLASLPLAKPGG